MGLHSAALTHVDMPVPTNTSTEVSPLDQVLLTLSGSCRTELLDVSMTLITIGLDCDFGQTLSKEG